MGLLSYFRSDPKSDMRKAAKAYRKMQSRNIDLYNGFGEHSDQNVGFFDTYADVIKAYITKYKNTIEDDEDIRNLKRAFEMLHRGHNLKEKQENKDAADKKDAGALLPQAPKKEEKDTPLNEEADVTQKLKAQIKDTDLYQEPDEKENKELSKDISNDAMKGLREISQWMLRNSVKSGMIGGTDTSDEAIGFVNNFALKQPARVKLYAYYLIEKGKRKETDPLKMSENITESQLEYVPNLEKFKDKMVATKFKFWKRINAGHIYWNKLQEAFQVANANRDQLKTLGDMNVMDISAGPGDVEKEEKGKGEPSPADKKPQDEKAQAGNQAQEGQNPVVAERELKLKELFKISQEIVKLRQHMRAAKSQELKDSEKKIKDAGARFYEKLNELCSSDKKVGSINVDSRMDVTNEAHTNKTSKLSFYVGLGGTLANAGGKAVNWAGNNNTITWGLDKATEEGKKKLQEVQLAGNIIGIVGASVSIASLVIHTVDVIRHSPQLTAGGIMMAGADIAANAVSTAKTMTASIQGVAGASEDAIKDVGAAMSIVTGSFNVLNGGINTYFSHKQKSMMSDSEVAFNHQYKDDALSAVERKNTKKAGNTARLGQLLANERENVGIAKMVAGGLDILGGILTLSGVGSIAGAVLSGVATGINLGTYLYKYIKKKKIVDATIDDYINTEAIYLSIVGTEARPHKDQRERIIRQIRIEAASRMGFASKTAFFNAITTEYAKNIYIHIFSKDKVSKVEQESGPNAEYFKMLKALHLKPDFAKGKPTINTIAYQLQNI